MGRAFRLLRDRALVDEHGYAWTIERFCAETIIAGTLVGMPWLLWSIFA